MLDYIKREQDDLIDDAYFYEEWLKQQVKQ
jgi:hypothetical protein